jgi:flagellar hook assembly protein FlgD
MDMSTGTEDPEGGNIPAAPMITVYPNPFSDSIEIRFEAVSDLETGGDAFMSPATYGTGVEVSIYDLSGRLVRKLSMDVESSARHSVTWDGHNDAGKEAASGIYFCRVTSGAAESSAKMLLIR